ncbi:hypothetical protein Misp01_82980 [Microtetraspora sp. NBRC 13810]|uniref:dTMP kinase n=1 Tax=Microtetraspora sp. NBRC 13810 TaxID=3030990 RepID=UPI0024A0FD96|nr:dTMP kinase [Microtetraspora sp. NBRC 13810]GLW13170.1 hypothetical protein Misp01_82980 [Microtetraspora sp. NBRC 13810]
MTLPGRATPRRKPAHVLANVPYRRLWTSMSMCSLGDWLNIIALTALAGNLTQSSGYQVQSLAIGGVFVAKMLPAIVLGPLAGAVADRFDRRLTMVVADILRFALVLSIPLVGTYQWVIVATFLVECVNLFWVPAKDATVPNLVPKERLEEANQLNLLVTYGTAPVAALMFAALSLPAALLGGMLPIGREPTTLALFLNAVLYLASAALIFNLRGIPKGHVGHAAPSVLRQVVDGWRFVGGNQVIRGLVIGMLGAFAAGGAVVGVAKIYVETLEGGDAGYGTVFGAVFVGMAAGMFFGPRLLRELSRRRLFGLAILAAGFVLALIALVHDLVVVILLTVVLGACAGIAWIIGYTLIGLEVEDRLRGRTFSFLQSTARIVLLLVVAVAPTLAGLFGQHPITFGPELVYRFDGANIVMLAGAVLAMVVGVLALRHMDDRKGVSIFGDLFAAVRGERFAPEAAEERSHGLFIAFEGGEGSGKTTQSRMLAIWLRDQGFDVVQTREPGATKVGMRLRAILLDAAHQGLSPRSEALLYAADRAEHVEKVIRPALRRGATVISDRYVDSSLAYQGAGRALDQEDVARINSWATGGLTPDLTVLIDVPPSVGLTRMASPADRIESEPLEFHERVRREFRALAATDPDRYLVLDGTQAQNDISRLVQDRVREILSDPVPVESEEATGTMPAIRD